MVRSAGHAFSDRAVMIHGMGPNLTRSLGTRRARDQLQHRWHYISFEEVQSQHQVPKSHRRSTEEQQQTTAELLHESARDQLQTIWTPMTTALNASGLAMLADSPILVVHI